jgi:hypothetical protein
MTDHAELIERLQSPANWMREDRGEHWKNARGNYDRAPFEAADAIAALVAERDRYKSALEKIDKFCPPPYFDPSAYAGKSRDLQRAGDIARAALAQGGEP